MNDIRHRLHFIWADKIALWLAILAVAMTAICWTLVAVAAGIMGANHVVASLGLNGGPIVIAWAGIWALLRAIDFIAGGSTYKMFMPPPESEPAPGIATTNKPMAAM